MTETAKHRKVRNLYDRATTDGERAAARAALLRMGLDPDKPQARSPQEPLGYWSYRSGAEREAYEKAMRAAFERQAAAEKKAREASLRYAKAREVFQATGGVAMHPEEWMTVPAIVRLTRQFSVKPIPRKSTVEKRIRQLWEKNLVGLGWIQNTVTPVFIFRRGSL